MILSLRNAHFEPAAALQFVLGSHGSSVQLYQRIHQGESDSAAFVGTAGRALHPVKALKQPWKFIGGNARARVANRQLETGTRLLERNLDFSLQCELQRIRKQI